MTTDLSIYEPSSDTHTPLGTLHSEAARDHRLHEVALGHEPHHHAAPADAYRADALLGHAARRVGAGG